MLKVLRHIGARPDPIINIFTTAYHGRSSRSSIKAYHTGCLVCMGWETSMHAPQSTPIVSRDQWMQNRYQPMNGLILPRPCRTSDTRRSFHAQVAEKPDKSNWVPPAYV